MPKDYGSWKLSELRDELRKRNASTKGRKAVLVQRLINYDQMFGDLVNHPETSYRIDEPGAENFRDIHSNTQIPNINEEDIRRYTILGERDNLMPSKNMYDEQYIISCRAAEADNNCFVKAICAAEMRKNMSYNVTVKLTMNNILEAQCECAAGMGPHAQCKHVLVIMYAIADFSETKSMKIRTSPTSKLQTFHKPVQIYSGEPVESKQLKLKADDERLLQISTYDPRPVPTNKEKFIEQFHQITGNFVGSKDKTPSMPIQQMIQQANKRAVHADHDYLKYTAEESFINDLWLTEESIDNLEKSTKLDKNLWKKERLLRLQSSNFGKICKCKCNTSKEKLAKSLLKNIEVLAPSIKHGIKYEKEALKKITEGTGMPISDCGLFVHRSHQFLASTPDGLVGEEGLVEVKCPYSAKYKTINPETVPYIYMCENEGQIKLDESHNYYYQVQGQMACTGRKYCLFAIYTIAEMLVIQIPRDDNFIEEMIKKLKSFYDEHFKHLFISRHFYNIKF